MKSLKVVVIVMLMLILYGATSSYALMIGDAPNPPYGTASHTTAEWQQLGESNIVDDGVWWSTDGGSTWGHDDIITGQSVEFKFTMWRAGYGRHEYDQLKTWVDWNQDGYFNNTTEVIISEQWFKEETRVDDDLWKANPTNYTPGGYKDFFTGPFLIADNIIGDLWLRARVHCNHVTYDNITPYGNLWQGEVEDWSMNVNPVPEPATMFLLGTGLLGLAGFRRKKAKK